MHRDIKSILLTTIIGSNILVNREGEIKIADFGLAKYIPRGRPQPKTPNVVTLTYRAPEVLFTRGNYDFKIDVWSVGYLDNK
jgi:cyclin-dependent kinase 12/13